jgi:uncharacterized protein YxjI
LPNEPSHRNVGAYSRSGGRVHPVLANNLFLVKEHIGLFKAANNYDIYDPETGRIVMHCREPKLGIITKVLRFTEYKRLTPFDVRVTTPDGEPIVRVERGVTFLRSRVRVYDECDRHLGGFRQKLFSIGGAFEVLDATDRPVCRLQGKWTGWEFRFLAGEREVAHVTKKWAGIGKELFTTADTYMLQIADDVPGDHPLRQLVLASVVCIDMVLKE